MTPAPVIDLSRKRSYGVESALAVAYGEWQRHHDSCAVCGHLDWFDPGAPRPCPEKDAKLYDAMKVTGADGGVRYYVNAADPTVLCAKGRPLFEGWRTTALKASVSGRSWATVEQ